MSDGDRGKRGQNLIAAGLCAIALLGAVILAFAIGSTLGVNSGRDEVSAREHYERTKQDNLRTCVGREGAAAIECVSEAIEASQEQSDSRQDLYAQRDMSSWAFWLLMATIVTLCVTIVGVWFVKRTLDATLEAVEDTSEATEAMREANKIAQAAFDAEMRPYLGIKSAEITKFTIETDAPHRVSISIKFKVKNYGRLSAQRARLGIALTSSDDEVFEGLRWGWCNPRTVFPEQQEDFEIWIFTAYEKVFVETAQTALLLVHLYYEREGREKAEQSIELWNIGREVIGGQVQPLTRDHADCGTFKSVTQRMTVLKSDKLGILPNGT